MKQERMETIVRLKIISQTRTPETITGAVGLQCDRSWRSGDRRARTIIVEKDNGWVLHSGLPRSASLDEHIARLLSILEAKKEAIRSLSMTETVEFSIVIYSSYSPPLSFDGSIIEKLAELGGFGAAGQKLFGLPVGEFSGDRGINQGPDAGILARGARAAQSMPRVMIVRASGTSKSLATWPREE